MEFGAERRSDELFRAERVSKSYGHIQILHDVSLVVPPRSIVGLVGENGAGKTTLFNILTGLTRPDAGAMHYRGEPYSPPAYNEAFALGISRVFQEQALVLNVPVYENLVLSQESRFTKFGQLIDRAAMISVAERIIDDAGLDIDVRRNAGAYDFSKRQAIEIARACMAPRHLMGIADPLVLLDEPTSALDRQDERTFIELLARMRQHASFVFVSHRLTEVRELCDSILVMKDGRLSAPLDPAAADEKVLHGLMVGRERADDYYHVDRQIDVDGRPIVCSVRDLSGPEFTNVSFDLRRGEVLGLLPVLAERMESWAGKDRVFIGRDGGPMRGDAVRQAFDRARRRAGMPGFRFHDLRHTGQSLVASTGATVKDLMRRLGHASPMAANRYLHTVEGRDAEIASALSDLAAHGDAARLPKSIVSRH